MKLNILKSVVVITPTIVSDKLKDAVVSVQNQSYPFIKHVLVVDGKNCPSTTEMFFTMRSEITGKIKPIEVVRLAENTGNLNGQKFYGHRIYAAFAHLVNEDYVFFLDEDNWYEPNHIETLVKVLDENPDLAFTYSLRNIYDENKNWLCRDDCESLGNWPTFYDQFTYLIDTSAFGFRRDFIRGYGHLWYSGWGGDRTFLKQIRQFDIGYKGSGFYTLNYRLDGNPNSPKQQMFLEGNKFYSDIYEDGFPWQHPSLQGVKSL